MSARSSTASPQSSSSTSSPFICGSKGREDAAQLTPFLTVLFKAVESSPGAALVFTLAIGKSNRATDAYGEENEYRPQTC